MKDLIILGAGPAGLSASIYASRYNISHMLIGAERGGYLNDIHKIENYPGFTSISGMELSEKMVQHAEALGTKIVDNSIKSISVEDGHFNLISSKESYQAKNVIYSIGTSCRKLQIPGEEEFLGKGVSYCATCDASFFKNRKVIVVGGGNSAGMAALLLAEHAQSVLIVYRRDKLRCAPSYVDQIEKASNIEVKFGTTLKRVEGKMKVEAAILCKPPAEDERVEIDGIFVEIGSTPNCAIIQNTGVKLSESGFIVTNEDQSTSVPGFYAAGDITTSSNGFRQIVTAASEGAIASLAVFNRLKSEDGSN